MGAARPKTNPNGANQYLPDPRQRLCWEYYIDPKSPTFSIASKSAVRAGYTVASANLITTEAWFIDRLRRLELLPSAEKVFRKTLTMETSFFKGETEVVNDKLLRIQTDVAKFVAETQGKEEGYSKRNELTGPGGAPFIPVDEEKKKKSDLAIHVFLDATGNS